jgi:15-cis-phytoene synthase
LDFRLVGKMKNFEQGLSPPMRLAIVYAKRSIQARLALLLQFDTRMAGVVGKATEPLVGQMKLAWWRDVIGMPPERRPVGEPLLGQLNAVDDADLEGAILRLLDAWESIVVYEIWSDEALHKFARARGDAVFSTYCEWADYKTDVDLLGSLWALNDLKFRFGNRVNEYAPLPNVAFPKDRTLRPLTILTLSVQDISGPRLLWHALTGR